MNLNLSLFCVKWVSQIIPQRVVRQFVACEFHWTTDVSYNKPSFPFCQAIFIHTKVERKSEKNLLFSL